MMIDHRAHVRVVSVGCPSPAAVCRFNEFLFNSHQEHVRKLAAETNELHEQIKQELSPLKFHGARPETVAAARGRVGDQS